MPTSTRTTRPTHRRPGRAAFLALGALSPLLLLGGVAPTAGAAPRPDSGAARPVTAPQHSGRPTIVLVHGAWADSGAWSGVVTRLQCAGYKVVAFPEPLRGLSSDAGYLRSFLATVPGPVVLVGHSYGGAVITNAATGAANVTALVYVDAFAPAAGESVAQLATAQPGSVLASPPQDVFDVAPYPGAPQGDGDLYVKQDVFVASFANDLPRAVGRADAATQRPITGAAVGEPSGPPAWATIPSWYLVGTRDKVLPPAEQRLMAKRAHAHTVEVAAGHLSLQSHPGAVTRLITAAVRATH